jgi:outer membrane murein-binding lipoprotein Lpp
MDEAKLENRLTTLESSQQYMAEQIVDMQDMQTEIRGLALSVNDLAGSVKRLVEDMCKANQRLDRIEARPGKWLDQIIGIILAAIVGGLIGYLINML